MKVTQEEKEKKVYMLMVGPFFFFFCAFFKKAYLFFKDKHWFIVKQIKWVKNSTFIAYLHQVKQGQKPLSNSWMKYLFIFQRSLKLHTTRMSTKLSELFSNEEVFVHTPQYVISLQEMIGRDIFIAYIKKRKKFGFLLFWE